mmetsp:Transcript_20482/g.54900  ORF Transcript_20482/g.54900 Transcript_20482/m.54900 type:complete len:106 (-) Transcript_20482:164-481(-)
MSVSAFGSRRPDTSLGHKWAYLLREAQENKHVAPQEPANRRLWWRRRCEGLCTAQVSMPSFRPQRDSWRYKNKWDALVLLACTKRVLTLTAPSHDSKDVLERRKS